MLRFSSPARNRHQIIYEPTLTNWRICQRLTGFTSPARTGSNQKSPDVILAPTLLAHAHGEQPPCPELGQLVASRPHRQNRHGLRESLSLIGIRAYLLRPVLPTITITVIATHCLVEKDDGFQPLPENTSRKRRAVHAT
jgi:hypothetical protein